LSPTRWLPESLVLELHARVIRQSGGTLGLRDPGLLESAMHRARQRESYDPRADVFRLAASYAFGIIKNHPFLDGNKRTGVLAIEAFLYRNGIIFDPAEADTVKTAVAVATSQMDEAGLAEWIRHNSRMRAD
jgi:death on curing protein